MNIANTFGLKGKAASGWLTAQGLAVPEQPNRWLPLAEDGRILRLHDARRCQRRSADRSSLNKATTGQPALKFGHDILPVKFDVHIVYVTIGYLYYITNIGRQHDS